MENEEEREKNKLIASMNGSNSEYSNVKAKYMAVPDNFRG